MRRYRAKLGDKRKQLYEQQAWKEMENSWEKEGNHHVIHQKM
jgi:hypothetical protein